MKKVVQTNIGGRHFFMDEDAYQVMNEYLDSLKAHFEKEKEVANEIIGDIEQRMAELLESRITDGKKVISPGTPGTAWISYPWLYFCAVLGRNNLFCCHHQQTPDPVLFKE